MTFNEESKIISAPSIPVICTQISPTLDLFTLSKYYLHKHFNILFLQKSEIKYGSIRLHGSIVPLQKKHIFSSDKLGEDVLKAQSSLLCPSFTACA